MPNTPQPTAVAKDLAELFPDTDPAEARLEALRIATKAQRLWAWAGIFTALFSGGTLLRLFVLWKWNV